MSASSTCRISIRRQTYPFVSSYVPIQRAAGVRLFKVIEDNIRARKVRVMLSTPAQRLIIGDGREIRGLTAEHDGRRINIKARRARHSRLRRLRGEPRTANAVLAGKAGAQRGLYGQYRRRHSHGAGCRRGAVAHVALPRRLRLQASGPEIIHSASVPSGCRTGFRARPRAPTSRCHGSSSTAADAVT